MASRFVVTTALDLYVHDQWRTGRKVGRTIYAQLGDEASDLDVLIGVMDSRALASAVVEAHNASLDPR